MTQGGKQITYHIRIVVGYSSFLKGDAFTFHADHPFLYLITESSTGAILFAGKFTK